MTNFSIFESNLSGYFGGNVKRSHIEELIEEVSECLNYLMVKSFLV